MMTPFNAVPQPVPMYTDVRFQWWRRPECQGKRHQVYHLNDELPLVLIVREASPHLTFSMVLRNAANETVNMGIIDMRVVTVASNGTGPAMDYITPDVGLDLPEAIPTGEWWMEFTDSNNVKHFSERITFTDCTTGKVRISYGADCEVLGIPFSMHPFRVIVPGIPPTIAYRQFKFWFDASAGTPRLSTETQERDDGTTTTVDSRRTVKKNVVEDLFPDYILTCWHAMQYMSNVQYYDPLTELSVNAVVGDVSFEYAKNNGALALCTVELQMDTEWRNACCDEVEPFGTPCFPVEPVDIAFAISDQQSSIIVDDGETVLVTFADGTPTALTPYIGKVVSWDADAEEYIVETPAIGTIYRVGYDYYADSIGEVQATTDVYMIVVSDPDAPDDRLLVHLNSPLVLDPTLPANTPVFVQQEYSYAEIGALGRYVRILSSNTASPGFGHVAWTGTEEQLSTDPPTVINTLPGSTTYWRAEYFLPNCEYGVSIVTVLPGM